MGTGIGALHVRRSASLRAPQERLGGEAGWDSHHLDALRPVVEG